MDYTVSAVVPEIVPEAPSIVVVPDLTPVERPELAIAATVVFDDV
jgi:hypothetical protein